MNILFKLLSQEDIPLLFNWLKQKEINDWYKESDDWNIFRKKFESKINDTICPAFIVYINNIPIGYMQYYIANKVGDGWWPNAQEGTVGIDQFIGDLNYIGKGYGTAFIKEFISKVLFAMPWVKKVMVDVDPKNLRAINCYKKVGFKEIDIVDTPDGTAILMEIERELE